MKFFENFRSNTTAAGGNQHFFESDGTPVTGRVFYKITYGGTYNYSFLYSNITDSTYADGKISHMNLVCRPWKIISAKVGQCSADSFGTDFSDANGVNASVTHMLPLTFDGAESKNVAPGEFFSTDPVSLTFNDGDYLCIEMTFAGTMMPYHEESLLPIFRKNGSEWEYDRRVTLPGMIGCDREVSSRIAYIGDSITQGIGTAHNSYTHWNAVLAEKIGDSYSHWNTGIGFARANDTATDGAWLYKAKHCDIAVVCIGANDILQNLPEDQIHRDIKRTVDILARDDRVVVIQTIPPFEYGPHHIPVWERVNAMIKSELADKVAMIFDTGAAIG
ncbi:MAG: SGNH/GDSL hydrolase family protein, partial [Clostridia bacterium]|nr:SGNH/GDSL hydrolase family protein [Clostridia bacterium]